MSISQCPHSRVLGKPFGERRILIFNPTCDWGKGSGDKKNVHESTFFKTQKTNKTQYSKQKTQFFLNPFSYCDLSLGICWRSASYCGLIIAYLCQFVTQGRGDS
jgi:hypothetical protein